MVDRRLLIGVFILGIIVVSGVPFATTFSSLQGDNSGVGDNVSTALSEQDSGALFATTNANEFCTDQYDNCNPSSYEAGEAEAYSVLEYDDIEYIGTRSDGTFVVEPGTEIRYRCRGDLGPDGYDSDTSLMDAQDTTPSISVENDARTIVVETGEQIQSEGTVDISFERARSVQFVCAGLGRDDGWWAYTSSWSWYTEEVVEADDSDSDGVFDVNDACPETGDQGFGLKDDGCPIVDSDGDGVPDPKDDCPERGSQGLGVKDNGCPIVDSDGDGVVDMNDACPDQGSVGFGVDDSGCPLRDADNDGVVDRDDACPDTYGSKGDGCPTLVDRVVNFFVGLGFPVR